MLLSVLKHIFLRMIVNNSAAKLTLNIFIVISRLILFIFIIIKIELLLGM